MINSNAPIHDEFKIPYKGKGPSWTRCSSKCDTKQWQVDTVVLVDHPRDHDGVCAHAWNFTLKNQDLLGWSLVQ